MAIAELLMQGLTREEAVRFAVNELGMVEEEARFVLALELGEIDGDIIEESEPTNA